MKIINLPFAGGNKYSFNQIFNNEYHHNTLEIKREHNQFDIEALLDDQVHKILKLRGSKDYILYGHSMGALIGYLVCQKLQELNLPLPKKLVVSGKKHPSISTSKMISDLPDSEFWDEILALGGVPDEVKNSPKFVEYILPLLRHDLRLVEGYQYVKRNKLTIPIDVFYGSEEAEEEEMLGWREETTKNVAITQMKGNHFFIFEHKDFFLKYFKNLEFNATI